MYVNPVVRAVLRMVMLSPLIVQVIGTRAPSAQGWNEMRRALISSRQVRHVSRQLGSVVKNTYTTPPYPALRAYRTVPPVRNSATRWLGIALHRASSVSASFKELPVVSFHLHYNGEDVKSHRGEVHQGN